MEDLKMNKNIGQEFMRLTRYENLGVYPKKEGAPTPTLEAPLEAGAVLIDLPASEDFALDSLDFKALIEKRETLRKYTESPISLDELAYLLWGTQGVKSVKAPIFTKRTVPSAGSRHPFDTYLLVNKVTGLEPGLYRYMAIDHKLAKLPGFENINQNLTEACLKQQHVKDSAVTFAWTVYPNRTNWRYSDRGYRYIHLDAGHVCQNLYLLAESIDCGICAIAAFDDVKANKALGLDGEERFVIYLASLGKRISA